MEGHITRFWCARVGRRGCAGRARCELGRRARKMLPFASRGYIPATVFNVFARLSSRDCLACRPSVVFSPELQLSLFTRLDCLLIFFLASNNSDLAFTQLWMIFASFFFNNQKLQKWKQLPKALIFQGGREAAVPNCFVLLRF